MKYTLYTCGLVWIFEWLLNLYAEKILTDRNIQIFYEICTCSKQIWGTNLGSEQPLLFGSLWPDKCLPWGPPTCPLADQRWSRIQSPGPFRSSWRSGWFGNLTRRQRIARCPLKIKIFETFSANFKLRSKRFRILFPPLCLSSISISFTFACYFRMEVTFCHKNSKDTWFGHFSGVFEGDFGTLI